MDRLVTSMHQLGRALHFVAGAVMLGLTFMVVANIVGRSLLGVGVRGTVELTQLAMVGIVYFGLAYAQTRDDHITVDLLYLRLPRVGRAVLDAFASLVTIAVLALLAWQLYDYRGVLEAGGRETNTLGIPLHPVAWVAIFGTFAFTLTALATLLDRARGNVGEVGRQQTGGL